MPQWRIVGAMTVAHTPASHRPTDVAIVPTCVASEAEPDAPETARPAPSNAGKDTDFEELPNPQGGFMQEKAPKKPSYVYVKDSEGVEYVCRLEDLKKLDELSEEEKAKCMVPPGSA